MHHHNTETLIYATCLASPSSSDEILQESRLLYFTHTFSGHTCKFYCLEILELLLLCCEKLMETQVNSAELLSKEANKQLRLSKDELKMENIIYLRKK